MKKNSYKLLLSFVFVNFLISLLQAQIVNKGIDIQNFSKDYYSIPFIDLDGKKEMQVIVDKEKGQYLGHPSTVLLEDGKTMYCVYPKGHGIGSIVMKKSEDGGITWSDRLPVPKSWGSSLEVPTLYPVEDAAGNKRIVLFSGRYPARMSFSEDNCQTWTELKTIGDWGGIVVMGDVIPLKTGKGNYMAMFHDDQRYFTNDSRPFNQDVMIANCMDEFTLLQTFSFDGGLSWSFPRPVFKSRILHLCEPGIIRSPDGKQIAVLLRENSRRMNSFIIFSDDEGKSLTPPRQLPNALTGDRHQAIYAPDGRLVISFRDNSSGIRRFKHLKDECKNCDEKLLYQQTGPVSPTTGDWVAWVGKYDDLLEGKEGQYRVRLKDNTKGVDCGYPAIELLPNGTIVITTYGYWDEGESPYILSVRFNLEEIDALAKK